MITDTLLQNICRLPNKNIVDAMIGESWRAVDRFHDEILDALKCYSKTHKFDQTQLNAIGHLALLEKIMWRKFSKYMEPKVLRQRPALIGQPKARMQEILTNMYHEHIAKKYK